jgi:hypothetical protein
MPTISLSGSVGQNGTNSVNDVKAVQQRLASLGFSWLVADGVVGLKTIGAIKLFQAIKNGDQAVAVAHNDGTIDVGGDTHKWLEASNAPKWQILPAGSTDAGYVNIEVADPADHHDFATDWLAATIAAAGATYRSNYLLTHPLAAVITVNDASLLEGGDTPDHSGHETGLSCDLRLPRTDGTAPGNTTYQTATYDRDAARAVLKAFREQPLFSLAYFNDPVLIGEGLCAAQSGHDDHLHIQIKPPARN